MERICDCRLLQLLYYCINYLKPKLYCMQTQPPYLKSLKILHLALLAGQVIFTLIAILLVYGKAFQSDLTEISNELLIAAAAFGLILTLLGNTIYKKKIDRLRDTPINLYEKLDTYRATSIMRWAMIEAPVLLSIIFFLLTGNQQILAVVVVLIIFFVTTRPQLKKISEQLNISEAEIEQSEASQEK